MKKMAFMILMGAMAVIGLYGCGPSQKEIDDQQKIEDSIAEHDRENSIDGANKYFEQDKKADSIAQAKKDSAARAISSK